MDAPQRRRAGPSSAGRRRRHQLLRHRQRLLRRLERGDRRTGARRLTRATRSSSPPSARPDAPGPERRRPLPQGDHDRDRQQPRGPPRHRLRRPLPDPPLRPAPRRGDDGGPPRRRQGGQGPLPRRLVDVDLAVREAAARRRPQRLDPLRHACRTTTTSSTARRSARCSRYCVDAGRRRHPVEPARPRHPHPALDSETTAPRPTSSGRPCTPTATPRSCRRSSTSPPRAGSRRRASPSRG